MGVCWYAAQHNLLTIADAIGGQWAESGRTALIELFTCTLSDDSMGIRLLGDIRDIFQSKMADKLTSAELIVELVQIESSPWAEFNRGKTITPITLARLLKPFDIGPRTIRTAGGTPKGYLKEFFEDAWTRYLRAPEVPAVPEVASETQHQQQGSIYAAPERCFEPPHEPDVAGAKSAESAANIRGVAHVAGQNPDSEVRGSKRRVTGEL